MASPLMSGPMAQMFQTINTIQQLKQNPSRLGQFLYEHNKINQTQLEEINKMGGNPEQIGMYLVNQNVMPQQEANQLYQQVPGVQQALQQNK